MPRSRAQLARPAQQRAGERERLVRPLGLSGGDLAFRAAGLAARPAGPAAQRSRSVEMRGAWRAALDLQIARIELDALAKSYGLTQATRFRQSARAFGRRLARHARQGDRRRASTSAASSSSCKFRCSISVRRACARPRRPTCRRSTAWPRWRSTRARRRARPIALTAPAYDIAAQYRARCCRCARSSRTRRSCATTPCRSTSSRCSPRRAQRIASTVAAIEAKRDFWLADTDLDAAILGGGIARPRDDSIPRDDGAGSGADGN